MNLKKNSTIFARFASSFGDRTPEYEDAKIFFCRNSG